MNAGDYRYTTQVKRESVKLHIRQLRGRERKQAIREMPEQFTDSDTDTSLDEETVTYMEYLLWRMTELPRDCADVLPLDVLTEYFSVCVDVLTEQEVSDIDGLERVG